MSLDIQFGEEVLEGLALLVLLVLQLLDQVYALRRRLRQLSDAIEAQPPELREAVRSRLGGSKAED